MVQGSISGPILYALFVSPLFDLAKMTLFADDNYIIHTNKHLSAFQKEMKTSLKLIFKWLKHLGLRPMMQRQKCVYSVEMMVTLNINGVKISSKNNECSWGQP